FGIQDTITVSSKINATAGFSADRLNGLQAQDLSADRTHVVPFQIAGVCGASDRTSFDSCTDRAWAYNPVASLTYVAGQSGSAFITYAHKSRFPTIKDRYSYRA